MKINRRELSLGLMAAALSKSAAAQVPLSSGAQPELELYKRSLLNMNYAAHATEYLWINHFHASDFGTPGGFVGECDLAGYPNTPAAAANVYGGALSVPYRSDFAGPYVLTGKGSGDISISNGGGWWQVDYRASKGTFRETGKNSGRFIVTAGNPTWYIVVNRIYSAPERFVSYRINSTVVGSYLHDLAFYRQSDESDLLAGKYFRAAWKQAIVDMNPSTIRFMRWNYNGGYINDYGYLYRWSDRTPPFYRQFTGFNQNTILPYPPADNSVEGTAYWVAPVLGMPAAMMHGEICQCAVPADWSTPAGTRAKGDYITAINKAASAQITTANGYTYNVGDKVRFSWIQGMCEINGMVGAIQSINVDGDVHKFTVDIDTRQFDTFLPGNPYQNFFGILLTLNVGGRGAYPVLLPDASTIASFNGPGHFGGNAQIQTFIFDKNVVGTVNPDGSHNHGAWIAYNMATQGPSPGRALRNMATVPAEICAKLINELEEMIVKQGKQGTHGPINPWICIPHSGMLSIDPDYNAADNYAVNMVDTMLHGASGFAGIPSRCDLLVEYSNETFNYGSNPQRYCSALAYWKWPSSGYQNVVDISTIRAANVVADINAAFPKNERIKHVLGSMWNWFGPADSRNSGRINGTMNIFGSRDYPFGSDKPITHFWAIAGAPYLHPWSEWDKENLNENKIAWLKAGGQIAISSVSKSNLAFITTSEPHSFNNGDFVTFVSIVGVDCRGTSLLQNLPGIVSNSDQAGRTFNVNIDTSSMTGVFSSGSVVRVDAPAQEQYCVAYLRWMLTDSAAVGDEKSNGLNGTLYRQKLFSAAVAPHEKIYINYEGWEELGLSKTAPSDRNAFIMACKRSQAMANRMTGYLKNCGYVPAVLNELMPLPTFTIPHWGFTQGDSYGYATGGIEWSGLSKAWEAMQNYNNR
jgi:hypothetical protein